MVLRCFASALLVAFEATLVGVVEPFSEDDFCLTVARESERVGDRIADTVGFTEVDMLLPPTENDLNFLSFPCPFCSYRHIRSTYATIQRRARREMRHICIRVAS